MILNEDTGIGDYRIKAYEPGVITVNDTDYSHSIIVSPCKLISTWRPQSLAQLEPTDLAAILSLAPAIVLLGTGVAFKLPPMQQLAPLYEHKLGVECMDSGAACRTYSALAAEGRHVVAALLIN